MVKKPHNVSSSEKNNDVPNVKKISNNVNKAINNTNIDNDESTWEQLDAIYYTLANALVDISSQVNGVVLNENFTSRLENHKEAFIVLKGFKSDIEQLTSDLIGIKSLHKNRSGTIQNEVDLLDSLNIYDNYVSFQNRFDTCVVPILNILTDLSLEVALNSFDSKKQLNDNEPTKE